MAEAANELHVNFYETRLLEQDTSKFFEQYDKAKLLYGLLMDKIKERSGMPESSELVSNLRDFNHFRQNTIVG